MKMDGFHVASVGARQPEALACLGRSARRAGKLSTLDTCPDTPDHEAVLTQLDRILRSDDFDASARNRAFLRYVVNETLGGRSEYIKGYTIAQEVFHRDPDFDPQLDPVVRIEASRLRRSLERYYLTAGRHDRIRLDLPKGGYVPRFELCEGEDGLAVADQVGAKDEQLHAVQHTLPSIVVLPFVSLGEEPCLLQLARGIAEEIIGRLLEHESLIVVSEAASPRQGVPCERAGCGSYVLKGSVRISGGRLRLSAHMLTAESGRYMWARSFDRQMNEDDDVLALQEDVAGDIARCIAAPEGVIARLKSTGAD